MPNQANQAIQQMQQAQSVNQISQYKSQVRAARKPPVQLGNVSADPAAYSGKQSMAFPLSDQAFRR